MPAPVPSTKFPRRVNVKRDSPAGEVLLERRRQIENHGYTVEHNVKDEPNGTLGTAAALLASPVPLYQRAAGGGLADAWPWTDWDKREDLTRREKLVIAGALILAEIERLDYVEAAEAAAVAVDE